jgi:hypothetical protein
MSQNQTASGRAWLAAGLIAGLLLASFALAQALAQTPQETSQTPQETPQGTVIDLETPQPTLALPTDTPPPVTDTTIRLEVVAVEEPVPKGDEFEVQVLVENVEHLAGFDFTIDYDPKRLEPVQEELTEPLPDQPGVVGARVLDLGQFVEASERGPGFFCSDSVTNVSAHTVTASCSTTGPPTCVGGAEGASGAGMLGRVIFKSKGGGTTKLTLLDSTLAPDDFEVCFAEVIGTADLPGACLQFRDAAGTGSGNLTCEPDGASGAIIEGPTEIDGETWVRVEDLGWATQQYLQLEGTVPHLPHNRIDAEVELEKTGSSTLIIIIVVVVVLVIAGGAGGGYLWYRRRANSAA